jgi:hypothetical protein
MMDSPRRSVHGTGGIRNPRSFACQSSAQPEVIWLRQVIRLGSWLEIAADGATLLLAGALAEEFTEAASEDVFRMRRHPAVGEPSVEIGLIFRGQVQQHVGQMGPRHNRYSSDELTSRTAESLLFCRASSALETSFRSEIAHRVLHNSHSRVFDHRLQRVECRAVCAVASGRLPEFLGQDTSRRFNVETGSGTTDTSSHRSTKPALPDVQNEPASNVTRELRGECGNHQPTDVCSCAQRGPESPSNVGTLSPQILFCAWLV